MMKSKKFLRRQVFRCGCKFQLGYSPQNSLFFDLFFVLMSASLWGGSIPFPNPSSAMSQDVSQMCAGDLFLRRASASENSPVVLRESGALYQGLPEGMPFFAATAALHENVDLSRRLFDDTTGQSSESASND